MSPSSENSLPPTHAATASSPNSVTRGGAVIASSPGMSRNLRIAGILLLCGLLVTIASLIWKAPLAFLMFAGIGCLLVFLGVVFYLLSLVSLASDAP